jgi:hypothetical protein
MTKRTKVPNIAARLADHVLHGTGNPPTAMLGPVVWDLQPGSDTRRWYFIVCSVTANNQLRIDQFTSKNGQELAERIRAELAVELVRRRPIVLHDFSDELEMARWCEVICPGDKSRRIRANLERERIASGEPQAPK